MKKALFKIFVVVSTSVLMSGCSSKQQVNPTPEEVGVSTQKASFIKEEAYQKAYADAKAKWYQQGLDDAAKIFEDRYIPYLRSMQKSALMIKEGMICNPPIFIDSGNKSNPALVIGKAHICEPLSAKDVIAKFGGDIPTIPGIDAVGSQNNKKSSTANMSATSEFPTIKLPTEPTYYATAPVGTKAGADVPTQIKVPATFANREILKQSDLRFNELNDTFTVEFNSITEKVAFCKQYTICK